MERKRMLQLFHEAQNAWGSFDDFPVLPPGTDPMPHISRNTVSQPFYLVSDQDQVLINLAGEGELWLKGHEPERMSVARCWRLRLSAGRHSQPGGDTHAQSASALQSRDAWPRSGGVVLRSLRHHCGLASHRHQPGNPSRNILGGNSSF